MQLEENVIYSNAMEPLVIQEVERQLAQLSPQLVAYIHPAQVIAYALNRLPALYATSERGWQLQQQRVKNELQHQVVMAVRQAVAAVQSDPLRAATPIKIPDFQKTRPNQDSPPQSFRSFRTF